MIGQSVPNASNVGIHASSRKMSVPLVDATPVRCHGPRTRYTTRPAATKSSPRPPKISWTPPYVLRTPARSAQIIPPNAPARIATTITTHRRSGERPGHPGGRDGADHDLALDADVPQTGGEGDHQPGRCEEQRRPGEQRGGDLRCRAEGSLDEQPERLKRRRTQQEQQHDARSEGGGERNQRGGRGSHLRHTRSFPPMR